MTLLNLSAVVILYYFVFFDQPTPPPPAPATTMNKFLYFAYGSNLLKQRIHIQNPSAVRVGIGKLNEYRLDFNKFSKTWNGCPATIVPDVESHVWGALWELDVSDIASLDKQEGVHNRVYEPFEPVVAMPDGKNVTCRCYKLVDQPKKEIPLPQARRPSIAYLRTIQIGAKESDLPADYMKFLEEIPHNGNVGPSKPWL